MWHTDSASKVMGINIPPTPKHQHATFRKCRYRLIAAYSCNTWPSHVTLVGWALHLCSQTGKKGGKLLRDTTAAPQRVTSRTGLPAKILAKCLFHTRPLPMCIWWAGVWEPQFREREGMVTDMWAGAEGHPSFCPRDRKFCSGFQLSLQFPLTVSLPVPRPPDLSHSARVSCKITS